jgi:uncharacterized protein (DUF1501 family)
MFVAGRAFAAPAAGSRMLLVFLRGGYDAVNIVAPTGSDFYHEARPTIGLGKPDPANPLAPLSLDGSWSLHPALKDSILPLWRQGQVAFVPFAGPDDTSRSHFETQNSIELGQSVNARRDYNSGFLARLAGILDRRDASIAFTSQVPLCFRGSGSTIPNLALTSLDKPVDKRRAQLIQDMYKGHGLLEQSVSQGFQVRETVIRTLEDEIKASARGAVDAKGFELSAQRIGTLMREHFNLAFVDVGGWDTHVKQGAAKGYLADRIGEVGRGLAAFVEAIGPEAWRSTTVIVISEFGRTFRENGGRGTDHGHGSVYWVMGGAISGGKLVGAQVDISPTTLNQNRDLPVLTDYRSLLGGIAARQFGLTPDRLAQVFPGAPTIDLGLI